jgi:hypothetical protein
MTNINTPYMDGFNDYIDGQSYNPPMLQVHEDDYMEGWQDGMKYLNSLAEQYEYQTLGYAI